MASVLKKNHKLFMTKPCIIKSLKIDTSYYTNTEVQGFNRIAERRSNKTQTRKTSSSNHNRTAAVFIHQNAADGTCK